MGLNQLSNVLSIVGVTIAFFAFKLSKESLVFNQRLIVMKESYEPIYQDIIRNCKVDINSNQKLNFNQLKTVKISYIYPAFDIKIQVLINSIIELSNRINELKRDNDNIAKKVIEKFINEKLSYRNNKVYVTEVYFGNESGNRKVYNQNDSFYELILSEKIIFRMLKDRSLIWVKLDTYDIYQMSYYLENHLKINLNINEYYDATNGDIDEMQQEIYNELIQTEHYQHLQSAYEELSSQTNELNSIIVSRVKKIINT